MANRLPKFKQSDQLNAARRDDKKYQKSRGGAKNNIQLFFEELDEEQAPLSINLN